MYPRKAKSPAVEELENPALKVRTVITSIEFWICFGWHYQ